jgi:hypothetical protein
MRDRLHRNSAEVFVDNSPHGIQTQAQTLAEGFRGEKWFEDA